MKVELNGKYRRVGTHEPVRVICVDRDDTVYPCLGLYAGRGGEGVLFFNHEGCENFVKVIEEVPATDWTKVAVDTPIWVRITSTWYKRHFNKFEKGHVHFWPNGYTSFTSCQTSEVNSKLPEDCSLEAPQ